MQYKDFRIAGGVSDLRKLQSVFAYLTRLESILPVIVGDIAEHHGGVLGQHQYNIGEGQSTTGIV
ncbi:MAG: hypothetical protein AAFN65_08625, partial [Bacteroidota bacterium]